MFIESLNRHLTITSLEQVKKLCTMDKGFWNVISLLSAHIASPRLEDARRHMRLAFDDAENESNDEEWTVIQERDIAATFEFWESTGTEAIAIHCAAGLSRSTALGLVFLTHSMHGSDTLVEDAVTALIAIRPQARPNARVLELGLRHFLPEQEARELMIELLHHPLLFSNRFNTNSRM